MAAIGSDTHRRGISRYGLASALIATALLALVGSAQAQGTAPSFAGKTIRMIAGGAPGGGYDLYARLVAAHLGRHLPGEPTIIVQNMEGAGSLLVANYLANVAPKDGTVLGGVNGLLAIDGLLYPERVKFDPREFPWIGSALREVHVGVAWNSVPIKSFDDVFHQELIVSGSGGTTDTYPQFIKALLNPKIKLISGYDGTKTGMLAMERGEVTGVVGISWASLKATNGQWLQDGKIRVFVQFGMKKHPELPNVSWIYDYARSEEDREAMNLEFAIQEFGRPFIAPPATPAPIVALLRRAFDATMIDPRFVAEAASRKVDIDAATGEEIQGLIAETYKASPAVVERVRKMFNEPK